MTAVNLTAVGPPGSDDYRVKLSGNPLRLAFSASPWRSAGYLFSYLIVSGCCAPWHLARPLWQPRSRSP
jgi:hypothetical protein